MRNRTEEINVRVFKTEKNLIRRKARKCGMNMSEYLRTLGTDTVVREAPKEGLMQAYRKLARLHDGKNGRRCPKRIILKKTESNCPK